MKNKCEAEKIGYLIDIKKIWVAIVVKSYFTEYGIFLVLVMILDFTSSNGEHQ